MTPVIYGEINKKVVVLVGNWEPLLPTYYSIVQEANIYCIDNNLELLLVIVAPHSSVVGNGKFVPRFHCTEASIHLLNRKFCGAVCKLLIDEGDSDLSVIETLFVTGHLFDIVELWIIDEPILNNEVNDSFSIISQACDEENIRLNILSVSEDANKLTSLVRKHLSEGNIQMAAEIMGQAPIWTKQTDTLIPVGWKPGNYKYYPLLLVADKFTLNGRYGELKIFLDPEGRSVFKWPDDNRELIAIID